MAEQPYDPGLSELQRATNIWEQVGSAPVVPGYQKQTGAMPILEREVSTGRTGYPTTTTPGGYGGIRRTPTRTSPGGYVSAAGGNMQQTYKPVEFKGPGQFKMPEYKPPERDLGEEKALRREYMAPGLAQIRRSTQQAIISSKSMDNPNARSLFINKALQGVGSALEQVTSGASRQARAESMQRYTTELNKYYTGWRALAEEAKANYDAQWKEAVMNFQEQQWGARSGYDVEGQEGAGIQQPRVYRAGRYGGLHYA